MLELIVKRGRALLDARSVLLLLVEGDQFHLAAGAGQVSTAALGGRFPLADSAMGEVLFSGRPERIDDVPARLRMSDRNLGVTGAATALLVPLVYRNTPLGLLAAFDRFTGDPAFGDEEERLFLAFAASAATAVATARSVAEDRLRHSIASAEQERRRWARELHDETLQALGALQVLLSSALRRGDSGGAAAVGARGDRLHRDRDREPADADHRAATGGAGRDRAGAGDREPRRGGSRPSRGSRST